MGVYISNMTMPKEGYCVSVTVLDHGAVVKHASSETVGRAVSVSHHGRLIDADALLESIKGTQRYFDLKFDIESAPTVIPADNAP